MRPFLIAGALLPVVSSVVLFAVSNPATWSRDRQHPHVAIYMLAILVLAAFANSILQLVIARAQDRFRVRAILNVLVHAGIATAVITMASWVELRRGLIESHERVVAVFENLFDKKGYVGAVAADFRFIEHHYLNYALSPDRLSPAGVREINSELLIRRREPIRPRESVRLRVLALGGSTTFDEFIDDEARTWVGTLESRLRARLGNDVDVINGGVPAYTLQENMIHYVTMLTHLQPDVVILFEGYNDVHARLGGHIAFDYSNYRSIFRGFTFPEVSDALKALDLYRVYYLHRFIRPAFANGLNAHNSRPHPPVDQWLKQLERNTSDLYRSKLETMVSLLEGQGIRVMLVPQYMIESVDAWAVAFRHGVDQHNAINAEVALTRGHTFCPEVPRSFDKADVVDDCHFNTRGAEKMATIIDTCLQRAGLLDATSRRRPSLGARFD